ncbi:hypothetical protein B0H67DRAFT_479369 [Lasiosphaeris hirsuta]|uniref:Transcription initiation factor TFIID subunit 2 n=1 Tax=Lasiosphaeris hirsuta TaxID=260670 RepID=A0AA40EBP2_9PEZI|nr:hypothetical protein B0H67DRAFT_479369 [Lasiosphaeris hirsuta]
MPSAVMNEAAAAEAAAISPYQGVCEPFTIIQQEVELEVNFREKSINGVSTLLIFPMVSDLEEIMLDARQCDIDVGEIRVNGVKTTASYSDPYDLMQAPRQWQLGAPQNHVMRSRMRPLTPDRRPDVPINERDKQGLGCVPADRALKVSLRPEGTSRDESGRRPNAARTDKDAADDKDLLRISIPFRSKRIRDGLHFVGVDDGDSRYPHVYTRHSIAPGTASCIFPCVDDPGLRHSWKLSIKCPRTLGDAFAQPLATQSAVPVPSIANKKRKFGEVAPPPPQPQSAPMVEEDKLMEITVVCSGNLSGEQIDPKDEGKKIMTFEVQNSAAHHIAFAIGPFEHIDLWSDFRTEEADEKLGANAAKIHAYCLPGRVDEVLHTCAPIVAAADYFAPEFGKYPFESYKVCFVEDIIPDTTAATSMSLCSTRLLYSEEIIDPEIEVTRKLVHALASQYLGVHIVPNQRSDSWLVIGIQWLMTDLFMKTLCGNNWYRFHLKAMADKLVEADINRPSIHDLGEHLHIGDFELEFMALKAPLVLFILDQRMSKIPGSTGVIRVVSQMVSNANINNTDPTCTSVSAAEFRRACEKKSQYRPDELWDQWVYGAGCPKLSIKQRFNKKNLNVDIVINQTQGTAKPKSINKEEFWREFQEEIHNVYAGEVPRLFTGPFTVRIHEADGTPYEHYQSITDKDKNGTNLSIAYNTKYKRLKRTKKAQAAATTSNDKLDIQEDDVVYFNMLGDVLMTEKDTENWGLQDWSKDVQVAMDQESYEWIRFDCNFEWVCETVTDMPGYMYLAQLQQDRDVVAHQDALLFFKRGKRHGVAASIETRTTMDRRYYWGIRVMALEDLPKQADQDLNYIGLAQLILSFRHFFCDRIVGKSGTITFPPSPNDFHDKAQYAVQSALPGAIARTREREKGRCSKDGRNFLLDLLLFNDNTDNEYSDQFYIGKLLEALTTSLIPDKQEGDGTLISTLDEEEEEDAEFKRFIEKTIGEIDKYRRMDEWTSTYQNIWTTTALNCKMRLMKARVIPISPIEFVQYLQDNNIDLVRIKAFECLVELGLLSKTPILKGIAAIAFGENKASQPEPEVEVDDSGLIIEQGEAEIQQRKLDAVRKDDITHALRALKEELKGNPELPIVIWRAVESPIIGLKEKAQLLELCSAMFEPEYSMLVTLNYPKRWTCERVTEDPSVPVDPRVKQKPRCIIRFVQKYRTEPRVKIPIEPPPPPEPIPQEQPKPPEPKKIKLSSKPSFSAGSTGGTPAPAPLARHDSISVTMPRPAPPTPAALPAPPPPPPVVPVVASASDTIAVQPVSRISTPVVEAPAPPSRAASVSGSSQQPNGGGRPTEKRPKPLKKRKSDENEGNERPKKIARTEARAEHGPNRGTNGRSKVVTVRFTAWKRLREDTYRKIRAEQSAPSTIVATPVTKRLTNSKSTNSPSPIARSPASTSFPPSSQRTNGGSSSNTKQRKPLPTFAPHPGPPGALATVPVPNGAAATAPAPAPAAPAPKKIKLKLKMPSQKSPT